MSNLIFKLGVLESALSLPVCKTAFQRSFNWFSFNHFPIFASPIKTWIKLKLFEFYFSFFGRSSWYCAPVNLAKCWANDLIRSMMHLANATGIYFQWKCNKCSSLYWQALNNQPMSKDLEMFSATGKHSAKYDTCIFTGFCCCKFSSLFNFRPN